jgi:mRNA interferase MazF
VNHPKIFEIYTARFPFIDIEVTKIRPVIVLSKPCGPHRVVAVLPVSSQPTLEDVDVALTGWEKEGLIKPSVARVHRITTLLQSDLTARLGNLNPHDSTTLRTALRTFLNL